MIKKVPVAVGGGTCCAVGCGAAGYGICHEVEKEDNSNENSSLRTEDKSAKIAELEKHISELTEKLANQGKDDKKSEEITKLKAELATEKQKSNKKVDEESFMNAAVSNKKIWSWSNKRREYFYVNFSSWKGAEIVIKNRMFFFQNKEQVRELMEKILPSIPPKSLNNTVDTVWSSLSSTTKDGKHYAITLDNFRRIFFK